VLAQLPECSDPAQDPQATEEQKATHDGVIAGMMGLCQKGNKDEKVRKKWSEANELQHVLL
jgi:hypothetical protein